MSLNREPYTMRAWRPGGGEEFLKLSKEEKKAWYLFLFIFLIFYLSLAANLLPYSLPLKIGIILLVLILIGLLMLWDYRKSS